MSPPPLFQVTHRRALHVGALVVIVAAWIGLVAGLNQPVKILRPGPPPATQTAALPTAPTYRMLLAQGPIPRGEGSPSLSEQALARLPDRSLPQEAALELREPTLTRRAHARAYDGAPPTIPHAVEETGLPCLGCHQTGIQIGGRIAPPMSHTPYTSCTQCHVAERGGAPGQGRLPPPAGGGNTFVGLAPPSFGERAWGGAPPVIPHRTWMRQECMSCHGPLGANGLKTSHPSRQSCTQCHAPTAALDQHLSLRSEP